MKIRTNLEKKFQNAKNSRRLATLQYEFIKNRQPIFTFNPVKKTKSEKFQLNKPHAKERISDILESANHY